MHYFVIATNYGNISVYKWDHRQGTKQFMHTFKGHSRAVTSLKLIKSNQASNFSNFVSASLDGSIRIWSLDKLIELYKFEIDQSNQGGNLGGENMSNQIVNIKLINDHIFAIFSKGPCNRIEIGQISHLATSYFISKPRVLDLSKGFSNKTKIESNSTEALISTFDNNSILLLRPEDGSVLSTIYPPPTPTNIAKTMYCMYLKRVFVLL